MKTAIKILVVLLPSLYIYKNIVKPAAYYSKKIKIEIVTNQVKTF